MSAVAKIKVVNGWSGTPGCGLVSIPFVRRSQFDYSSRVIAAAWDFLVREFGEEIIPELAEKPVREVVDLFLTL